MTQQPFHSEEELLAGEIDTDYFVVNNVGHLLELLPARRALEHPLWLVRHTIERGAGETMNFVFYQLNQARIKYREIAANPPTTYQETS